MPHIHTYIHTSHTCTHTCKPHIHTRHTYTCAIHTHIHTRHTYTQATHTHTPHIHTYHLSTSTKRRIPEAKQPRQLLQQPLNSFLSRTTWVSRYQKGKTSLGLNEARDDGVCDGSGISWTICKQSAPRSKQITTPTPDALPDAQPTASKH